MKEKIISLAVAVAAMCTSVYAGMLEDAMYTGRLASYVQDNKDIRPALGQAAFEGRAKTGILDASAYIRQESARIILEHGAKEHVPILMAAARSEQDPQAKDEIFLSAYRMALKYAFDAKAKVAIIQQFFNQCQAARQGEIFYGAIPSQTFDFLLSEAEDEGAGQVAAVLENLQRVLYADDERMSKRLDEAKRIIRIRSRYPGNALFELMLRDPKVKIEEWMLRILLKEKSAEAEAYANRILLKLMAPDAAGQVDGRLLYVLKEMLEEKEFLRAENPNPDFETQQLPPSAPGPVGWRIQATAPNTVRYPQDSEMQANSYRRCLQVIHNTAATTTVRSATAVTFSAPLPTSIDFGLSYRMSYPQGSTIAVSENGIIYISANPAVESAPEAVKLKLKAVVTFSDNTSQEDFSEVEPYSFNYWEELNKRFSSAKPIRSVELRIIVDGKARGVFIDDCYLRRSDDAFMHMAPQVISASVAPQAIIAGEYVTLTAAVGADMPAGSKIIGQWSSNLEGQLGSPVEAVTAAFTGPQGRSRAVLTISQKLAQEGEHNLCFTARDSFGYDDLTVVKLLVLQPACVIAPAAGTSLIDSAGSLKPLSGVVRFKTNITGLGALGAAVTVEAKLLADNKTQGTVGSSSLWVEQSLDTAKVRNGIVDVQAVIRIKVQRAGSQVSFGPYYSNVLQVYINDPAKKNVLAVITASPLEGQSPFEVQFDGAYSFASQGKVITGYKWDFGDRSGSTQAAPSRVFSSNQAKPYTYTVKLTVKDSLPSEDTAEVPITVQPEALVRQFKCAYKAALAGEDVPLEAELSAFSGDTINIEISSDLEPGAAIRFQEKIPGAASGLFVAKRKITRTVRFSREGTHTLTLKAVNSYGSAAEMKTVVKVASLPQTVALIISNLPEQRGALCPAGTFKYGELVRFKVDNGILKTFLESGEYEISGGAIVFSEQSSPETAALTVPVTGLEFSVESYRITRLIPGDNIAVRAQVRGLVLQRKGASQGLAALNSSSADFRVTVNDCAGDPPLPPLPQGEELFELALGRDQTTLNSGYPTFPQDIVPGDNTPFTFSCIPKEENAELYQKFNNGELRYMGMDLMIISDYWPVQIIRNNMLAPVDHDPPYTEAEFEQSNRYRMRYIRPSRELWNFIAGMRSQNLTRCDLYLQCKVYLEDAAGRKWFALTDKKRFVIQKT